MAIAKWVGALDSTRMNQVLDGQVVGEPEKSESLPSATKPAIDSDPKNLVMH
ncbi:hypothetical protein D9M68_891530 [compost metagenome]